MNRNGVILYKGPSQLDGNPIMAIATNKTQNEKTGDMVQIWIMRSDISPVEAKYCFKDKSVCGNCPNRDWKSCYVIPYHGVLPVFKAFHRDRYIYPFEVEFEKAKENILKDKFVRIGAYGDPAAVPMYVWDEVVSLSKNHTGYTHQWEQYPEYAKYFMASCEGKKGKKSGERYKKAKEKGFRTFRVRVREDNELFPNEVACMASKEMGSKTNCAKCGLCNGLKNKTNKDVSIMVHGRLDIIRNFEAGIKAIDNKKAHRRNEDAINQERIRVMKEIEKKHTPVMK